MIHFLKTFCHVHQFTDPSVSSIPFLVSAFPLRYGSRKLSGTNNYSMAGPLSCQNLGPVWSSTQTYIFTF